MKRMRERTAEKRARRGGLRLDSPHKYPAQPPPPASALAVDHPAAVVSRRAADRIRRGHVWAYRSDIIEVPADAPHLIPIIDQRGIPLGTALHSSVSEIALRLVSTGLLAGEADWQSLLSVRLHAAVTARRDILSSGDTNACRLVFSEADALPGIIIDKYGELIIVQLLTRALDSEAVRIVVTNVLD